MNKQIIILIFILNIGGFTVEAKAFDWITIDKPGATATYIDDIDGNRMVGHYEDESGSHGFLYDGTNWTILDMPGARSTILFGISWDNIVGNYIDSTWYPHGFLYKNGDWISPFLYAYDIDGSNIVGGNKVYNLDTETSNTFNYPGSYETEIRCISGNNLVGWYMPSSIRGPYTFLYDGETWTTLFYLEMDAYPNGIDGSNIVGFSMGHGFLYNIDTKNLSNLDMPVDLTPKNCASCN